MGLLIEGSGPKERSIEEIAYQTLGIQREEALKFIQDALLQYPYFSLSETPSSTLTLEGGLEEQLDFMWLELTPNCNLTCVHCYASAGPVARNFSSILNTEDWKMVLEEGREVGCKKVQMTGGEPIELYTNATLLTQNMCDELKELGVHVDFS